jgi:hypothetical protein
VRRRASAGLVLAAVVAVVAVVAAVAAGVSRAAPPDAGVFVPGRSLGGVTLGSSLDDVVAAWGRAYGRCRGCAAETLYFNRFAFRPEGAGVELRRGRVVAAFTLWAPAGWRTAQGLAIDEPELRLRSTYAPLQRTACRGYEAFTLPGSGARSAVYVVDGRVWGFGLLARGHAVCL